MAIVALAGTDAEVDWFRVIMDLERRGVTLAAIGKAVGLNTTTIWRYRQGESRPEHSVGQRILALHRSEQPHDLGTIYCGFATSFSVKDSS